MDDLVHLLKEANITVITSETVAGDPKHQVENLKVKPLSDISPGGGGGGYSRNMVNGGVRL